MPRNEPLPVPAQENMNERAKANLADKFAQEPNIIRVDNYSNTFEYLPGTTGEVDYFVFDLASTGQREQDVAAIPNFESGVDKIIVVNAGPEGEAIFTQNEIHYGDFDGDGALDDSKFFYSEAIPDEDAEFGLGYYSEVASALAYNATLQPSDIIIYNNDPFLV